MLISKSEEEKLGLSLQTLCVCRDEIQAKVTVKLLWNTNTLQPLFYAENWLLYTHVIWPKKMFFYPLTENFFQSYSREDKFCSRYLCIFCERVKQNEIYACLSKVTQPRPRRRFYRTSKHCSNGQKPKIPNNINYVTSKNITNRQKQKIKKNVKMMLKEYGIMIKIVFILMIKN